LYELPEWVAKLDGGLLGHTVDTAEHPYGDDRFARALDKLYAADRASMVTDIALRVIETTGVDLSVYVADCKAPADNMSGQDSSSIQQSG
jgi:hypothetical protein